MLIYLIKLFLGRAEACSFFDRPFSRDISVPLRVFGPIRKRSCVNLSANAFRLGMLHPVGKRVMVRVPGIEPGSQAWEARILPMDHTRLLKSFGVV